MASISKSAKLTLDFNQVKKLVFQLPVKERMQLYREIRNKDWKKDFDLVMDELSQKARKSGYTPDDIPEIIRQVREDEKNKSSS